MTFDEWWDTTKPAATPDTFAGWEASCRQAWYAARKPCTCDGAGRGPGRACVVKDGGRLGELWRCADGIGA